MNPSTDPPVSAAPTLPEAAAAVVPASGKAAAGKPVAASRVVKPAAPRKAVSRPAPRRAAAKPSAPQPAPVPALAPKTPAAGAPAAGSPASKKGKKRADRPGKADKPEAKRVRDSFTMPQGDFELIAVLKNRALGFKRPTKKSELLRAGLQLLAGLSAEALKASLERLAPLKSGRPRKGS